MTKDNAMQALEDAQWNMRKMPKDWVTDQDRETIQSALAYMKAQVEAVGEDGLKPCPFCGGEAVITKAMYTTGPAFYAECVNDDCPYFVTAGKDETIKAWNTRKSPGDDLLAAFIEECG